MRYEVFGADRETGEDVEIVINASDEVDAEAVANKRNVMVQRVTPLPVAIAHPPPQGMIPHRLEPGHVPGAPTVNVHVPRRASSIGIVSLVLGLVAFTFCWVPLIGILSVPLSGLGLLFAIIGFIICMNRRGAGAGFPIAGGLVSLFALLITFAVADVTKEAMRDFAGLGNKGGATDEGPGWAKPPSVYWIGDIRTEVSSVRVDTIEVEDSIWSNKVETSKPYLTIAVKVSNRAENRKAEYKSWMGASVSFTRDYAALRDNHGNIYKRIDFGVGRSVVGHVEQEALYPGASVSDVLAFEPPIENVKYLRLELPAANFGGDGMIRFEIPSDQIERR